MEIFSKVVLGFVLAAVVNLAAYEVWLGNYLEFWAMTVFGLWAAAIIACVFWVVVESDGGC